MPPPRHRHATAASPPPVAVAAVHLTGGRRQREHIYTYKLSQTHSHTWETITLRKGEGPGPPPARRTSIAADQILVLLCHADGAGEGGGEEEDEEGEEGEAEPALSRVSEVRTLDLSDNDKAADGWVQLPVQGNAPNSVTGYAAEVWEGRRAVIVSGGVDGSGAANCDLFMLSLGAASQPKGFWRVLAEWPASILSGESFTPRQNHSMTQRPRTSSFWIFGGRGAEGQLLNDLYVFDMEEEQWSQPQGLQGQPPVAREHHSACFVADRYLVVYGGMDRDGAVIPSVSVYDAATAHWSTVAGVQPRACHKTSTNGGAIYLMGGISGDRKEPASPVPLASETFPYAQSSCLDFLGNNAQAVTIKPSAAIAALRGEFTVEAVVLARSFSSYSPIVAKTDPNFKCGFGLIGLEHPAFKGDPEEGPQIHFFVNSWGVTGAGQVCHVKVEYDRWYHVAGVYDGNELKLYINGTCSDRERSPSPLPQTHRARAAAPPNTRQPPRPTALPPRPTAPPNRPPPNRPAKPPRQTAPPNRPAKPSCQTAPPNRPSAPAGAEYDWPMTEEECETLHSKGDVSIGGIVGKYAWDGYIDECRLWGSARTEQQIKDNMNVPIAERTPTLLGQWTFNEGSGEAIIDSSGFRNHAIFERYATAVRSACDRHVDRRVDRHVTATRPPRATVTAT